MKLSFIVPIYNVKDYLEKCVLSLLHQDYEDYEIILVDDGSTDGSGLLADELSCRCGSRCRTIHQENRGLSAARNSGIEAANGEYVCFVDSDDYWEPNVLGGLMEQIENDKLDVLRFKWQNVNMQYEVYNPYKSDPYQNDDYSEKVTDGVDFLNQRLGTACYAWAYILKTDIAKQELFTEGIYFEDTDWTPRMLVHAKRIASTDKIIYNYLVREGSITNAVNRSKQKKVLDDKMRLVRVLKAFGERCTEDGVSTRWFDRMIAATVVSISGMLATTFWTERKKYIKDLKQMGVFPLSLMQVDALKVRKIKLMNINLHLAIWLMHIKNKQ